jgi:hypothetical protein
VQGKIINGKPFIDLNHFAANDILSPDAAHLRAQSGSQSGHFLLD